MVVYSNHVQLLAHSTDELNFFLLGSTQVFNIDLNQITINKPFVIGECSLENQVLVKEEADRYNFIVYIKDGKVLIVKASNEPNLDFQLNSDSYEIDFESFSDEVSFKQTSETSFSLFTQKGVYLFSIHDIVTHASREYIHPVDLGLTSTENRYMVIGKAFYQKYYTFVLYDLFKKELLTRNILFEVSSNEAGLEYRLIHPELLEVSSGTEQATFDFRKISTKGRQIFEFYELEEHRNLHLLGILSINGETYYLHNKTNGVFMTRGNAARVTGYRSNMKLRFLGKHLYIFGRSTHYAYKANEKYDYLYIEEQEKPISQFIRPLKVRLFRRYGYFKIPVATLKENQGDFMKLFLGNKTTPMHTLKLKQGRRKPKMMAFKKTDGQAAVITASSFNNVSFAVTSETEGLKFSRRLAKNASNFKNSKIVMRIIRLFFEIMGRMPRKQKLIIFESFHAKQYSDSPRAIYEYMREYHPEYQLLWSINGQVEKLFKDFQVPYVRRFTFRWFLTFPRAKYWVNNVRLPAWMPKPQNTIFVQTWHGTPLKKLGIDIEQIHMPGTKTSTYKKNFVIESSKWDFLVSPNAYSTEIFKRAFHFKGKVIESGYPRNDVLSNTSPNMISAIKKKLGIPEHKKIMLYAPTWRDNEFYQKGKYKFQFQFNLDNWKKEFGDEWVLLSRMHYLVAENFDFSSHAGTVYDVSAYPDIRDLYLVSDMMITDYSSVFFDFAILNRPIIFFMYDLEKYRNELRGFYINMEEDAPGPIVQTESELFRAMHKLMHVDVQLDPKFIAFRNKFASLEDGNATKRVVQTFLE
ncbi:CDP-glycerol glycerophosphotransferase family protein [Planococcus shixiaomingii]|uniref:CDP-glycerol glycerophosphotransferase family protein n=1 Tax=Planococcus shixiaomingii TaxID=3058393 RepID=UPI002623D36C|nr:CDP-glycerol glycerophosphotransferase family protein [Planococcus sp. N022]WKA53846.1 CDP-glycerol glycerophosphotransferase family protein [Planococcus sp. N022]